MNKLYVSCLLISGIFFYSYSTNPPDGHTGAPGERLCTECHIQKNPSQNGTITIEGFPSSITPNETYFLTAVNRLTEGAAVRGGFQVTVLGPENVKAGEFINPSATSAVTIENGRQYWDHDPALEYPDSNVVRWTVQWKAPDLPSGTPVTWYAAGNIADGNFQNIGDRIVTASGSGSIVLSTVREEQVIQASVYPNPGSNAFQVVVDGQPTLNGHVRFFTISGEKAGEAEVRNGLVIAPFIPSGLYLLQIREDNKSFFARWSKM